MMEMYHYTYMINIIKHKAVAVRIKICFYEEEEWLENIEIGFNQAYVSYLVKNSLNSIKGFPLRAKAVWDRPGGRN